MRGFDRCQIFKWCLFLKWIETIFLEIFNFYKQHITYTIPQLHINKRVIVIKTIVYSVQILYIEHRTINKQIILNNCKFYVCLLSTLLYSERLNPFLFTWREPAYTIIIILDHLFFKQSSLLNHPQINGGTLFFQASILSCL